MRKVLNDPWPLIILGIALSIRLIYIIEVRNHPFFLDPQLDAQNYDDWAWGIAQGNWIGGDKAFFISPFYAYFLAIVYSVWGHDYFIVRLIQVFLGSLTWVVTYWIGIKLFNKRVGILASLIGAFYSYSIFMDGELLKNSLAVFTVTLTIYTVLMAKERDSTLLWFVSGLLLGISVINMPNLQLVLPLIIVWGIDYTRKASRDIFLMSIFIIGVAITVAPVTIRNYIVEKDFVLVSYAGGGTFFMGNNKDSDGGIVTTKLYKLIPQREEGRAREIPEKALGRTLKSSEISHYWFSLGKKFVYENPMAFLKLTLKKVFLFWNWYEIPDNVDYYFLKRFSMILTLPLITYGMVASFALVGLLLTVKEWRRHVLSYGIISIFMGSVVLFVVFGRYRLPIVPLLTVYAAYGIHTMANCLHERNYKRVFLIAMLLVAAWVFSNMEILKYPPEHSQRILGNIYMKKEMYREAVSEYGGAIKAFPFDSSLRLSYAASLEKADYKDKALAEYKRLLSFQLDISTKAKINSTIGSISLEKGDRVGATKAYEEALRLDDNLPEALNNLAWLYFLEGERLGDARIYAERALKIEPGSPEYMDTLGVILVKENRRQEAVELLKKALAIEPESIEIERHLGEAMGTNKTNKR